MLVDFQRAQHPVNIDIKRVWVVVLAQEETANPNHRT